MDKLEPVEAQGEEGEDGEDDLPSIAVDKIPEREKYLLDEAARVESPSVAGSLALEI